MAAFLSDKVAIAGGPVPGPAPPTVMTPAPTVRAAGSQPPHFKFRGTLYQGTSARDVLTKSIDTSILVSRYGDEIELTTMNTGCTVPIPHARGLFASKRGRVRAIVEIVVRRGIPIWRTSLLR